MGQKHKPFREFRTPFPLRDIRENPRSNVRACAAGDGAICSKNRKIVPYHGANSNTTNGARLRSPSPIMAPVKICFLFPGYRMCVEPTFLENGYWIGSEFWEGKNVTYGCNKGYWLRGPFVRVCNEIGNWTEEEPTCEGKKAYKYSEH